MNELNALFRKRIGLQDDEKLTFDELDEILDKTAKTIPFENLSIMASHLSDINKENIMKKVLVRNEGGLCYELNTALYFSCWKMTLMYSWFGVSSINKGG